MRRAFVPLLLLMMVAGACTGSADPGPSQTPPGSSPSVAALNAAAAPLLPTDARALPDLDAEGFRTLMAQLEGTPVLVNFWAAWCGPCEKEAPHLRAAAETYGDRVQFLGIDILDSRGDARAFMDRHDWRYPSVFDARDVVKASLGMIGQPITLIFAADGTESFRWTGEITAEQLETELAKVL